MLAAIAKNRNSSTIRESAEKYLVITASYRRVSCLRLSANPLYSQTG